MMNKRRGQTNGNTGNGAAAEAAPATAVRAVAGVLSLNSGGGRKCEHKETPSCR